MMKKKTVVLNSRN